MLMNEPSSSRPVTVPSLAEKRAKVVAKDSYETSSDVDLEEVRR